jgi:putative Ca2+/H+ antiporter (TMEM165/GDT1 family)
MEAFIVSMLVAAVGEIGDKTQLLALLLADIPAVLLRHAASWAIPFKSLRLAAVGVFGELGLVVMPGIGPL